MAMFVSGSSSSTGSFGSAHIADKVGIGTTSPTKELHINGSGEQGLRITSTGWFDITQNGYNSAFQNAAGGEITFWNDQVAIMKMRKSMVGIGYMSIPDAHLHVSSSGVWIGSSTASLHVEGSGSSVVAVDGTQGRLFSVTDEMSGSIFSANTIAGLPVIEAFSDNTVNLGPFSSPVHIASSGNVGIGTTTPGSYGLDYVTTGNALIKLDSGDANYAGIHLSQLGTKRWEIMNHTTSGKLYFNSHSNEGVVIIENGGNVGIGTTSPASKLHINNTTDNWSLEVSSSYREAVRIHSTEANQGTRVQITNGSLSNLGYIFVVGDGGTDEMIIGRTDGAGSFTTQNLVVTSGGDVEFREANAKISGSSTSHLTMGQITSAGQLSGTTLSLSADSSTNFQGGTVTVGSLKTSNSGNAADGTVTNASNTGAGLSWGGQNAFYLNAGAFRNVTVATTGVTFHTGSIKIPNQPGFLVHKSSDQGNIEEDDNILVTWDEVAFDNGGDFASNTFTAPVTGKYVLSVNLVLDDIDPAAGYYILKLQTTNRTFILDQLDPTTSFSADALFTMSATIICDMDECDTAYVQIKQSGTAGSEQTDIKGNSGDTRYSTFSGWMLG